MRPKIRGTTQGAEGFGLGRDGCTYRRRFERDLGMVVRPFHRDIHCNDVVHRPSRDRARDLPVTTSDRSVRGGGAWMPRLPAASRAMLVVIPAALSLVLAAC